MKRALKIGGFAFLFLVVCVAVLLVVTFRGIKSVDAGTELGQARVVTDGRSVIGVVPIGADKVILIDAGNDQSGAAILAELSRRNLTPQAVSAILVTHGHPDHIGAIRQFPNAQVMALEREVGLVEGREGAGGPVGRLMPVRPTGIKVARALKDGEVLMLGDKEVRVFAVPGHTMGSAAYLVDEVLFLGDTATSSSDGQIMGAMWVFSDSQEQARESLIRLNQRLQEEGREVKGYIFGHSGSLSASLAPLKAYAQGNQ